VLFDIPRAVALKDLSEKFKSYNLNDILEEYLVQIAKIIILQEKGSNPDESMPAHHVEFGTVVPYELSSLDSLYREDYIKEVPADDVRPKLATSLLPSFESEEEKKAYEEAYQKYSRMFDGFERKLRKRGIELSNNTISSQWISGASAAADAPSKSQKERSATAAAVVSSETKVC
jgi:hypothetical protein